MLALACATVAFLAEEEKAPSPDHQESAIRGLFEGLRPHIPSEAEKIQRNLSQSGVNDRQIPLETRRAYARDHGLQEPVE